MFSIHYMSNGYVKKDITAMYMIEGKEPLHFEISSLISLRNKEDIQDEKQFFITNQYLQYKGREFQEQLYNVLQNSLMTVMNSVQQYGLDPNNIHIVHHILDLLDYKDILHYLTYEFKLQPPKNLKTVYDQSIEDDKRGSRAQTYLQSDYLELAALSIILKIAMLPVYDYAAIKQSELSTDMKEYLLFHLFKKHPIYHLAPMQKLYEMSKVLIKQTTSTDETESIRVLEKGIPRDELPFYILSIIAIQKVAIATLVDDNVDKNIITKIYNYINNKLKPNSDVSKSIRNKSVLQDIDSQTGDSESMIESFRGTTDLASGYIVEFNWALSSIQKIVDQLPEKQKRYIDPLILSDAEKFCKKFLEDNNITTNHIIILSIIFKSIIDPRALDYINIECLTNLVSVGFVYLWQLDCKEIALLLTSISIDDNNDTIVVNQTTNKSRLHKEIKEELNYYFPYMKMINEISNTNIAEEAINKLTDVYFSKRWYPLADEKYILEVLGEINYNKLLFSDMKILLANFIIKNERELSV